MSSLTAPAPAATVRVGAGTTAGEAVREAGLPGHGPQAVVVVRAPDGTLKDLAWRPEEDVDVEAVPADTEDGRAVIRHSAAHVLAQAVQQQFPDAKLGIGPPVADGFYYDFAVERPFTPEDLASLEKAMRKIVKAKQRFVRREYASLDAARAELADEPFKLELVDLKGTGDAEDDGEIMEVGAGALTAYDNIHAHTGERVWGDLCRGPHIPTTGYIPAFKITRSAAAYWRGDQRNAQLQRIYGTAWESQEAQDAYLERLAEAERRDHRRLGDRAGPVQLPRRDRLRPRGLPPQGRDHPQGAGGLQPAAAHRGRLPVRQHPARHQGGALRRPRGTSTGTARACSRRCTSTRSTTTRARRSGRGSTTTSSR